MKGNLSEKARGLPQRPGVYLFKNHKGEVIYVGKSVRLRERVLSYFSYPELLGPKTTRLVAEIKSLETIETESEIEALLLEADLIKRYKPRYNQRWKDDKRYKQIRIKNAALRERLGLEYVVKNNLWPAVGTSRKTNDKNSLYFGPFPQAGTLKRVLKTLRKLFPWCEYSSPQNRQRHRRACFYQQLGLCPGICVDEISLKKYWKIIDQLVRFLRGESGKLIKEKRQLMHKYAKQKNFEEAARLRDQIKNFEYVTQQFRDAQAYLKNPNLREDLRAAEIKELKETLELNTALSSAEFYIEGYDISNLGSQHTVGSRVGFVGGEADKSLYRRYKIRQQDLPNDYAAIQEILRRRFKKQARLPDLIIIDGGKGQVRTATAILEENKLDIPLLGVAKKEETLIRPSQKQPFQELNLPQDSKALNLILRVRDEAHRFAQAYHKHLRRQNLQ